MKTLLLIATVFYVALIHNLKSVSGCPFIHETHCGFLDGSWQEFANECVARRQGAIAIRRGICGALWRSGGSGRGFRAGSSRYTFAGNSGGQGCAQDAFCCPCPYIYDPVCGFSIYTGQWITYDNDCLADCEQVTTRLDFACPWS